MRKTISVLVLLLVLVLGVTYSIASDSTTPKTVYKFKVKTIDGTDTTLAQYNGKVLLIVNVASKCGHTPQYAGLEKLYEKYKDKGFVILGFPCNQFREQEPGTDAEIKTFCTTKYNVTFPLFDKIQVNGDNAHPLYKFLKKAEPDPDGKTEIGWNFTKFLIDRKGHPMKRFVTTVEPEALDQKIQDIVNK